MQRLARPHEVGRMREVATVEEPVAHAHGAAHRRVWVQHRHVRAAVGPTREDHMLGERLHVVVPRAPLLVQLVIEHAAARGVSARARAERTTERLPERGATLRRREAKPTAGKSGSGAAAATGGGLQDLRAGRQPREFGSLRHHDGRGRRVRDEAERETVEAVRRQQQHRVAPQQRVRD
eukprot:5904565-Prymnesium_polylepis.1